MLAHKWWHFFLAVTGRPLCDFFMSASLGTETSYQNAFVVLKVEGMCLKQSCAKKKKKK